MSSLPFVVRGSADGVEGWSSRRLPFEVKGWMVEYRAALREALGMLDPASAPVLVASFASVDSRPWDVENLPLYNLGLSAFAHLRCEEVVLAPRSLRRSRHRTATPGPYLPPTLPARRRGTVS